MANRTKRTPARVRKFLDALRRGSSVTAAAEAARVGRMTVYEWRAADPEFAAAWDAAVEEGTDRIEDEAYRRAVDGVDEPLVSAGKLVTTCKRYSDGLLTTLLKARRPEKYKERVQSEHTGEGGGPIRHDVTLSRLDDDALNGRIAALMAKAGDADQGGEA